MIAGGDDAPVAPLFAAIAGYLHYRAGLIASNRPASTALPSATHGTERGQPDMPRPADHWAADSGGKRITLVAVITVSRS